MYSCLSFGPDHTKLCTPGSIWTRIHQIVYFWVNLDQNTPNRVLQGQFGPEYTKLCTPGSIWTRTHQIVNSCLTFGPEHQLCTPASLLDQNTPNYVFLPYFWTRTHQIVYSCLILGQNTPNCVLLPHFWTRTHQIVYSCLTFGPEHTKL